MKASNDPRHNDKLKAASGIIMLATRMLGDVEREDDDATMQSAALLVLELEKMLSHYQLELQEILPARMCAGCDRETTHYRHHQADGVLCLACQVLRSPQGVNTEALVLGSEHADAVTEPKKQPAPRSPAVHDRATLLDAAHDVTAQRDAHYGDPTATFGRIAMAWTAILGRACEAHEVALCLGAMKLVRASVDSKRGDNWVDLAGYAACGAEVAGARRTA